MNKMKVRAEYEEYKQRQSCFPLTTARCLTEWVGGVEVSRELPQYSSTSAFLSVSLKLDYEPRVLF